MSAIILALLVAVGVATGTAAQSDHGIRGMAAQFALLAGALLVTLAMTTPATVLLTYP